jgi:hypothetical protein
MKNRTKTSTVKMLLKISQNLVIKMKGCHNIRLVSEKLGWGEMGVGGWGDFKGC